MRESDRQIFRDRKQRRTDRKLKTETGDRQTTGDGDGRQTDNGRQRRKPETDQKNGKQRESAPPELALPV